MQKLYFCHESSFIDQSAQVGPGTKIWHFCHISRNSEIGENCVIGQNVYIGPHVKIGDFTKIQNNVSVYEGVELGEGVFCGPSVVFTNVKKPRAKIDKKNEFEKTIVCDGATIGANATILPGVLIGRGAFVGAGSVVTSDIHDFKMAYGNPAKTKGNVCECGNFSGSKTICQNCR